jgi:hypothetical protein
MTGSAGQVHRLARLELRGGNHLGDFARPALRLKPAPQYCAFEVVAQFCETQ